MIAVLISTLYDRLLEIKASQFPVSQDVYYVISCQGVPKYDLFIYEDKIRTLFGDRNVSYVFIRGYGLSKNRNAAIDKFMMLNIDCKYFYISDDDTELCLDGIKESVAFAGANDLDMVVGKIATLDMHDHKHNYKTTSTPLTKLRAARVSSVEMILSRAAVLQHHLRFDEQFGLGAKYPSGEEYIFTTDALRQGCRAEFYPVYLCKHPPVTSGHDFYSSPEKIMAKGAMLKRALGVPLAIPICMLFTIKKYPIYCKHVNIITFYNTLLKGIFSKKI